MKAMIISDIHGSINDLEQILKKYSEEQANKLFILGDFLNYYGDESDYQVFDILNSQNIDILSAKGNCDDLLVETYLNFPLYEKININVNEIPITISHGHIYNKNNLPENCGKILITGHTHSGYIEKTTDRIYANPGSISKPRNNTPKSYLIIDEDSLILKNLEGEIIDKISIDT